MKIGALDIIVVMGIVLSMVRGQSDIDCSDPEARGRKFQAEGLWVQAADEFHRAIERCGNDAGTSSLTSRFRVCVLYCCCTRTILR
jgi:hypothetical protein